MKKILKFIIPILLLFTLVSCNKPVYSKIDNMEVKLKLDKNVDYQYNSNVFTYSDYEQYKENNNIKFNNSEDLILDKNNSTILFNKMNNFQYEEVLDLGFIDKELYVTYDGDLTIKDRVDTRVYNNYNIKDYKYTLNINNLIYNFRNLYNDIVNMNVKVNNLVETDNTCAIEFNNKELIDIYNKYFYLYTNVNYDRVNKVLFIINYEIKDNITYITSFRLTINKTPKNIKNKPHLKDETIFYSLEKTK